VGKVELEYVFKQILPIIQELTVLKNQFLKRKKGIRLLTSLAKSIGEQGFEKEPLILKMIAQICHDNNYKIRMDGALFYKEYLQN
jgi:hypothetical protein